MSRTLFCNPCKKVVATIEERSKLIKGLVCYCEGCNEKLESTADLYSSLLRGDIFKRKYP